MKPSKICCHWLEARLLGELFWGEQPPLTPVGCGGRSFFDQEVGSQISGWVSGCGEKSRPSRFFRFQVPDPFLFSFFVGLCCVSDTEG